MYSSSSNRHTPPAIEVCRNIGGPLSQDMTDVEPRLDQLVYRESVRLLTEDKTAAGMVLKESALFNFALDLFHDLRVFRLFLKRLAIPPFVDVDAGTFAEKMQESQNLRCLLFCEHIDLQVEMVPALI